MQISFRPFKMALIIADIDRFTVDCSMTNVLQSLSILLTTIYITRKVWSGSLNMVWKQRQRKSLAASSHRSALKERSSLADYYLYFCQTSSFL